MARLLDNSPSLPSSRRDSPRAAPYLTHELTHHGQVTLIPPQNAGRIRKLKQKGEGSVVRRTERERAEPRFNTSVPSARRARTTSARIPRQLHVPQTPLAEVRTNRESDIPEYPPPSFQEAILTPPVSPDSLAYITPSSGSPYGDTPIPTSTTASHPAPGRPSLNTDSPFVAVSPGLPSTSLAQRTPSISPLVLSAAPSPQPQHVHPPHSALSRAVSPASSSESTRQPVSESDPEMTESESDTSSDAESSRFMTPEPPTQWEADKRQGVPLENRVYRERLRLEAAESTAALVATPRPARIVFSDEDSESSPAHARRCSTCEALRPLDCAKAHDMRHPDDEDDAHFSATLSTRISTLRRPDTSSLPCSPLVAGTPVSPTMNAWSSTVTLASSSMTSPPKPSGLKRKESVILRKLFGGKGKEPDKAAEPSVKEESWEVVDSEDLYTSPVAADRPTMDREQSNASTWTKVAVPTSPTFITRPVRPLLRAPTASVSKKSPSRNSPDPSPSSSCTPSPNDEPKQRRRPPPPPPPRKLRTSPSVVWKFSTASDGSSSQTPKAQVSDAVSKHPFPSSPTLLSPRSRAASSLTLLTVPRTNVHHEEAGSSTHSDTHIYTPTYATTISSDRSSSPPASPTTPSHHYPGRPLPQVPHEASPLARPVFRPPSPPCSIPAPESPPSPTPRTPRRHVSPTQPDTEYSNLTELDVLASRLTEGDRTGRNYEDLLLLSEFVGPAQAAPPASEETAAPFIGRVEVPRRRILRDGRVKLKLTLLGAVVERCGVCLSQFKDQELAALCVSCRSAYHERCLRSWVVRSRTCPSCRAPLDVSP